jgi:Tol biopolymer transport system component
MVRRLPLDLSSFQASSPAFSPDAKAIVEGVTSGNALRYQPLDGSPAHLLTDPTPDGLTSFAYSPDGTKLAVLRLRKSSDVVLITDITGKQPR